MGLGNLHDHSRQEHAGSTINHPRAYDVLASLAFAGRRREVFTRLAALSGARPGDRVLDVGCGTGYLTRVLAPLIGPAGQVVGVDPAPSMVEHARRRAPANCSYAVGVGQALDLADESFDVVVTSLAVHHMPEGERGAAVREMFRVLRPGGRLLVVEFRRPANRWAAGLLGALAGPAHRHSPRDLLGDLVPRAGFDVEAEGELPPLLFYLRAGRPATSSAP
ncbi:class I SAM-dependent methyltransferase [Nonomuraea sp. NPDC047897]|uniref:class I SAM-dependent methyltransferase n=1 Tax=Nonomuraea sp. NPDC047897 TaxID=3364346 RepID=UPI0037135828